MTAGEERTETREGEGGRVLGLVTDPDMPTQVGSRLASGLTDLLSERTGDDWTVEVVSDPVTAGEADTQQILMAVTNYVSEREWGYAICLTDLPLLLQRRVLVADASTQRQVALVSLPALGGLQPYRRMRQMLTQLLDDLLAPQEDQQSDSTEGHQTSRLTMTMAPIQRMSPPGEDIDVRYTASRVRGWVRLVTGMVRTNRPSSLIFGLSSALAAAVAASAFGLSSTTIWQIGDRLGPIRQTVVGVAAVALLVGWLIASHGLWEHNKQRPAGHRRRLAVLYNASTVATLTIGVGCMYVGLFAVNVGVAWFLVTPDLLASTLGHPARVDSYLSLAWGFTSMGVIAGALGSSLESDQAVRQAAYGYREEQRRSKQSVDAG